MKCQVLELFRIKTRKGDVTLQAGQLVNFPEDKALILIQQGKLAQADMLTMKTEYSGLMSWLDEMYLQYDFDYTLDIEQGYTSAHRALQAAITAMDDHMTAGNLQGFRQSMLQLKSMYFETIKLTCNKFGGK